MNTQLKSLATAQGMDLTKVEYLAMLLGEDGAEDVIIRAKETQNRADQLGVAFKAPPDSIELDADDLSLTATDLQAIGEIVAQAVRQAMQGSAPQLGGQQMPATTKLTDSGPMSSLPSTAKARPADLFEQMIKGYRWDGH